MAMPRKPIESNKVEVDLKKLYWSLSLSDNTDPTVIKIDDINSYFATDKLIVSFEYLNRLQTEKEYVTRRADLSFDELRSVHQRTAAKVDIKQMSATFGKGAFSSSKGLQKGDRFVYAGIYVQIEDYIDKPKSAQTYLSGMRSNIAIDAKTSVSKARYIQHLPDESDLSDFGASAKDFPGIAVSNVVHNVIICTVNLGGKEFRLPVSTIDIPQDIKPNMLLGYSYTSKYWDVLKQVPSFFKSDGTLLDNYIFISVGDPEDNKIIRFYLTKNDASKLNSQRFVKLGDNIFIVPKEIPNIIDANVNGILLPAICWIQASNQIFFDKLQSLDVMLLQIGNREAIKPLIEYAETVGVTAQILKDQSILGVLLDGVLTLEFVKLNKLLGLVTALVGNPCQYNTVIDQEKFGKLQAAMCTPRASSAPSSQLFSQPNVNAAASASISADATSHKLR